MVDIYTDASVSSGIAVASCMLLTDKSFIGFDTNTYRSVKSSQVGELMAIRDGLRFFEQTGLKDDTITLYTDHEYAIRLINEGIPDKFEDAKDCLSEVIELVNKHKVDVQHIAAHQSRHNPNKVVDQVSRHKLRSTLRRDKYNV